MLASAAPHFLRTMTLRRRKSFSDPLASAMEKGYALISQSGTKFLFFSLALSTLFLLMTCTMRFSLCTRAMTENSSKSHNFFTILAAASTHSPIFYEAIKSITFNASSAHLKIYFCAVRSNQAAFRAAQL